MIINCFRVTDKKTLARAPNDDPIAAWLTKRHLLWVDVAEASPEDITKLLQPLDLSTLLVEQCVAGGTGARVIPLQDQLFFEFPVAGIDGASYLSILVLPELVVTISHGSIDLLSTVSRLVDEQITLPGNNLVAPLGGLLFQLSHGDVQTTLSRQVTVNRLLTDQEKAPQSVSIDDILQLKRELRDLQMVAQEKRHCFDELSRYRSAAFDAQEAGSNLQLALGNAEYMERLVDRLSTRVEDLHSHYLVSLQEGTNKRLATLTVITAVFLPLTLIAGIEGMNFAHMPELKSVLGYPATLGLMALIAIGMLLIFWRKGWFD